MKNIAANNLLTLMFLGIILLSPFPVQADGLSNWHHRNPLPGDSTTYRDLQDITYGNSMFVAVGKSGTIATSRDGALWTIRRSAITNDLAAITYGSNTYVAVDASGAVLTSSDGLLWTDRGSFGKTFIGIAYGNNRFVAVKKDLDEILTSPNGISWISTRSDNHFYDIAYGNGVFIGISASDGSILTSSEGTEWLTLTPATSPTGLTGIVHGGGIFVAVGLSGKIFTSTDGKAWTPQNSGTSDKLTRIAYGNGVFVAVGDAGTVLRSSNGTVWTPSNGSAGAHNIRTIVFVNSSFFAIDDSEGTISSSDGNVWTLKAGSGWNDLYGVAYGKDTFVAVGNSGNILASTDGLTWAARDSGTVRPLQKIIYGNDAFVVCEDGVDIGPGGIRVLFSTDGTAWTLSQTSFHDPITAIVYGNGAYLLSVGVDSLYASTDGITWENRGNLTNVLPYKIVYGNNTFVAVGAGGIAASPDGETWTVKNTRLITNNISYGNNRFFAVADRETGVSSDASTWTHIPSNINLSGSSAIFGNNTLVVVGENGSIIQSDPIFDKSIVALSSGWNFISFPYLPSSPASIETVLKDVSPLVRIVWGYDNTNKVWLKYSLKTQHSTLNTLDKVETGKGYWMFMDASGSINTAGWLADSQAVALYGGWNLVGYNGAEGSDLLTALQGITGKWVVIWNWENGQWYAKHAATPALPVPVLTNLRQGAAYWIRTNSAATWQQ